MRNMMLSALVLGAALAGCRTTGTPGGGTTPATAPPAARGEVATPVLGHEAAHEAPKTMAAWAEGSVLFDDLGTHTRVVTTSSREAQAYFDQGLRLTYGFNHDEATRSFARAAKLDPEC